MIFCSICGRLSVNEDGYCRYHQDALDNLQSSYEVWRQTSGVSWDEYIDSICELEETGRWVREVAEQIRSGDGPAGLT
ncbi:MAG: hypothetical protein ACFFE2_10970 [Candidatus Thorarchaeota archaeon]